ncbi:unnamed protein product [Phaedon cochleariae]|uniref:FLYWCH-type domain-containing protein n=1 Tax=Phaedon cochleariae TaxID=80249 RepID=A0A9N9SH41_PHACE|nr:unnamed protein product [Phaedon cochleariae]
MAVSIVKSSRGCDLLIIEKFSFCKQDVLKSGEVRWRCIKKIFKCLAKVYTIGAEFTVTRSDLTHNHEPDERSLQRKLVTTACKRKAQEDISEKPSKIIKSVLSTNLPEELISTDISLIRRNVYNSRRKLPKDIHEVHTVLDMYSPKTTTGNSTLGSLSPRSLRKRKICGDHFSNKDFTASKRKLKKTAVPQPYFSHSLAPSTTQSDEVVVNLCAHSHVSSSGNTSPSGSEHFKVLTPKKVYGKYTGYPRFV